LEAFADLHRENPRTALLVAGEFVSTDLERAVEPLLGAPGVARLRYLEEREFWLAAASVDACINLRYPGAGETSGITIRLMGIGKPVLVTDAAECARFPEDACLRIAPGAAERESLRQHMILLTSIPEVAHAIGLRAAAHVGAHHRVERIGNQYWDLLCECRT
jgi:glycosyltransferase involved in cell wall biosynthesis